MAVKKQQAQVEAVETEEVKLNADGFPVGALVTTQQLYEYERKQRRAASEKQASETPSADAS